MGGIVLTLIALSAVEGLLPAGMQDPPAKAPLETVIDAGDGVAWQDGDTTVTFLTGNVRVKRTDFDLQSSRAVV